MSIVKTATCTESVQSNIVDSFDTCGNDFFTFSCNITLLLIEGWELEPIFSCGKRESSNVA